MSINESRCYHAVLARYQARTGVAPQDTTKNIIQDIVFCILDEVKTHFKALSGANVEILVPPDIMTPTICYGSVKQNSNLDQTS